MGPQPRYRGHWATWSRWYSTTQGALRDARAQWQRETLDCATVATEASWAYADSGYRTPGDAWLAQTGQARRRSELTEQRLTVLPLLTESKA